MNIQVKNITLIFQQPHLCARPCRPAKGASIVHSTCMMRTAQTYFGMIFGTILECVWVVKVFKKGN